MSGFIHACVLHHRSLAKALSYRFSAKLFSNEMPAVLLREIAEEAYGETPELLEIAQADLAAVVERDPACHRFMQPSSTSRATRRFKRTAWPIGFVERFDLAYFIQMRVSEIFSLDLHPAAQLGRGLLIDHAHALVIGETAVVGDNVSLLHDVTLGGTGKAGGDRHPKIGDGVMIGAGTKVLGNITIGHCCRIAAGSVVLSDIPPCKTVAGVPARWWGKQAAPNPPWRWTSCSPIYPGKLLKLIESVGVTPGFPQEPCQKLIASPTELPLRGLKHVVGRLHWRGAIGKEAYKATGPQVVLREGALRQRHPSARHGGIDHQG